MNCVWCHKPRGGVIFPVDGHVCPRCQDPRQREWVRELDQAAHGVLRSTQRDGILWPYGANIEMETRAALLQWAESYGLKMSGSRTRCGTGLHWLDKGQCNWQRCSRDGLPDFFDHTSLWKYRKTGKPALVLNQPYGDVDPRRVDAFLSEYPRLTSEVKQDGWYAYTTTAVYIWNRTNAA